jgi:hypothetical protein
MRFVDLGVGQHHTQSQVTALPLRIPELLQLGSPKWLADSHRLVSQKWLN